MLSVGLTGSSGSGKGYISSIFTSVGIPCLDTDRVCREVYEKGHPCYVELVEAFGRGILDDNGAINRKALFELTFSDENKYKKLNSIAFKHIRNETEAWLSKMRAEGNAVAIIDAPMLYESGFYSMCDKIICVIADRETQIGRIVKRDGISVEAAELRLGKQKPNTFYSSRADYILDNSEANKNEIHSDTVRLAETLRKYAAEANI